MLLLSPLKAADGTWRTRKQDFPAGDPLVCYLPETERLSRVTVNGAVIVPEVYETYIPKPGDEVWLFPQWGYIPGLTEALLYAGVSLVVGLAVATASHFLFRPKPLLLPQQNSLTEATEERTFSFEGIRTAIGPGGVVPVVYGRHRIGGQLLRAFVDHAYTVLDDGNVTTAVAITNVFTAPHAQAQVWCPGHGFPVSPALLTVLISEVQGKTAFNNAWVALVVDADIVVLYNSENIDVEVPYLGGGLIRLYTTGIRSYQAVTQAPTLSLLLALGEGPIAAILTSTIEINGQPIGNFPGVEVYHGLGGADQTIFPIFGEARNTFSDGREIPATPGLFHTTTSDVHAFALNVSFEQGLYYLNERGDKETNHTELRYRFAVTGTEAWSAWSHVSIAADRTATVRWGIRREALPLDTYDIQVEFVLALQTDELRAKWRPTLESVTEFIPNTTAYPHTALLGIRALATDALRGALPNITVEVQGRTVRVGSFTAPEAYSDNPAWCIMDLLTNARYGRGRPDSEIDLAAFATYAAYCDQPIDGERRHLLHYVLDRERRAQEVFLETMGGSRGLLMKTAGFWTPRPTRTETPSCLLSWTNSTNLKLTYLRDTEEINVMEARFSNEEDGFQQDVITWPGVADWPAEIHKQSLDLRSITKPSRVIRALQYELNRRRFENMLLEMDCSPEALTLQVHDLFRYAHPLPGWGVGGRLLEGSTTTVLLLDQEVALESGVQYLVYVRHANDAIDVREIVESVLGVVSVLTLASGLSQVPVPRMTTFVFGRLTTDASTRIFRVTSLQRRSDMTIHLEAVIHNPTIYDDPVGTPLQPITDLFNPLGPPPPLLSLLAMEVTRVQASGASLRVVNLSWDVAPLSRGYAPYAGATILRRPILSSGQAGQAAAGVLDLGSQFDSAEANTNYVLLARVSGHVLDFDDSTVITGGTYQYRVVPVSARDVPNNGGAREVIITVTGPTTPGYFPGTPQNLRLRGQAPGLGTFEGRDIHLEWDAVPPSPLFTETFFIQEYVVEIWAPAQLYLMRRTSVLPGAPHTPLHWSYTYDQHTEDQIQLGQPGARRDVLALVYARTNTGLLSLEPASLAISNPPPDMSAILPEVEPLVGAALVSYHQWAKPRDFSYFTVYVDTVAPPVLIYQDEHIEFGKFFATGLVAGVTYYTQILPWDTFGPGLPSQIASFVPLSSSLDDIDTTPPAVPTGLVLTTGTTTNPDGTISTWVEAAWTPNTDDDLAGYQVHFRLGASTVPTVFSPAAGQQSVRWEAVPGNVTVSCRILAFDRVRNLSAFTAEVAIVTSSDTAPPGPAQSIAAFGSIRSVVVVWTPPPDADYAYAQVHIAPTNDRTWAVYTRTGFNDALVEGLAPNTTWYFWVRTVDTSGNAGPFFPLSPTAGVGATVARTTSDDIGDLSITETKITDDSISTPKLRANSVDANKVTTGELITLAAQIRTALITDAHITNLSASKISTGTLQAFVAVGVGNNIFLDGINRHILVYDNQPVLRVHLGALGVASTDYGIRIYDATGALMFDVLDGGVTAQGLKAGVIQASHLRTDVAIISVAAQIANALIGDAHITNLSASKLLAGAIQAQLTLGVGFHIQLDGANKQIMIFDDNGTTRVALGRLGVGGTDYGLHINDAAGQTMYSFTTGAQTAGIADAAITSAKIGTAQIQTAHIVDANITDAKIASLTATKLTAGGLTVTMHIGGTGLMYLDGVNTHLAIFDANVVNRVLLGKLGAGATDYGLIIRNAAGVTMWELGSGATTTGIVPNAVSASLVFTSSGGGLTNVTELEFATITFPTIAVGDTIWMVGVCTILGDGTSGVAVVRLRSVNVTGTVLHSAQIGAGLDGSLTVMHSFVASGASTGATFVLTAERLGAGTEGSIADVRLAGLRLQR